MIQKGGKASSKEVGLAHLHVHSDFSLLDGYAQVEELADRIPRINQKFLTITDHGMMAAVPRQIRACEVVGIQSIFGIEMYLNNMHIPKEDMLKANFTDEEKKEFGKNYHLLALAYTNEGYSNLVQLSSQAWLQFYKKARVKHDQILKHKEGVIFTSSCYLGEIGQAFDKHGEDVAQDVLDKYIKWFSPNFYLEIMLLDFKKQRDYNKWLVKQHIRTGIPICVTQDCHFCRKEDSDQQRYMLMIRSKKTINDFQNLEDGPDFELQDRNLWLKSEEELDEKYWNREKDGFSYQDIIPYELYLQAKMNTVEVAKKASGVEIDRSIKLPQIPDADLKFKEAVKQGYKWRGLGLRNDYINRLTEEVNLICKKGFASYFIIQQEIIQEARRVCPQILGWGNGDEAVGPGRGCLSANTKVVLFDGEVRRIDQIKIKDQVVTREGTIGTVTNLLSYDINHENLLNIKVYYGDADGVTLTKDHKILVEKLRRVPRYDTWSESSKKTRSSIVKPVGNLTWMPASEVQEGDWLFIPQPKSEINNIDIIDLSRFCNGKNLWCDNDYVYQDRYNPLTKGLRDRKIVNRHITLNNDWFEVIGKFAGDGYLRSNESHNVGFCFNSETEKDQIERIFLFFKNLGADVSKHRHNKRKSLQVVVKSRYIYKLFKEWFCDYKCSSNTKHIPGFVFKQSGDRKLSFLKGYFLADGGDDFHKIVYTTVSERLAYQTRHLALQVGIPSSIQFVVRKDNRPGRKDCAQFYIRIPPNSSIGVRDAKIKYQWHPVEGGLLTRVRKISIVKDIKKVYDITVDGSHNYLTTSFLVHNSAVGSLVCYCLGITDVDPIKHDLLFSRFLSESRGGREMKTRFTGIPMPEPLEAA